MNRKRHTGTLIRARMNEKNITQTELGKAVGTSHTRLSQWINGHDVPSERVVRKVAEKLDLDVETLRIETEKEKFRKEHDQLYHKYDEKVYEGETPALIRSDSQMVEIPILGTIPSGKPLRVELAQRDSPVDLIILPEDLIMNKEMTIAFWVDGDSMAGRVEDGNLVIIEEGTMPGNSDIAVVRFKHETVLKAIEIIGDTTVLRSIKENIEPIIITRKDDQDLEIIGKVIGVYNQDP